ncbi:TPA: hypothetical protein ACLBZ1_005435 [Bacillus cereus]
MNKLNFKKIGEITLITKQFDDSLRDSGQTVILHVEIHNLFNPQCVQICVITTDTRHVLFDSLVQCKEEIFSLYWAVHRIKNEDVENAPTPIELFEAFFSVIENKNIICVDANLTQKALWNTFNTREMIGKLEQERFYCLRGMYDDIYKTDSLRERKDIIKTEMTGEQDRAYRNCLAIADTLDQLSITTIFASE